MADKYGLAKLAKQIERFFNSVFVRQDGGTTGATVTGYLRSTALTSPPASGAGVELFGGTTGYINSYNRGTSAFQPLIIQASRITLAEGPLVSVPDAITATSGGVAASIATLNTEVTTNGDSDLDNVTLANGTSGQIKHIYCVVEGNAADTWKITPATMCGGTQITFAGVGLGCTLVYADNEGWVVVGNNGGTIS